MGNCCTFQFSDDKQHKNIENIDGIERMDGMDSIESLARIGVNIDKNNVIQLPHKIEYNDDTPILCSPSLSCYLCKKIIHSTTTFIITCIHCKQMIGHKSCVSYRMLLTPNCPFCTKLIK